MTQGKTFAELGVKESIVKGLQHEGITHATNIQEQSIPLIHEGKDLVGISRTGSGKTASFGIPLLEKVDESNRSVQGLVLAPTRELANQIAKELEKWAKFTNIKVAVVFGGVGFEPQVRDIEKAHIVVGTPGRILAHMSRDTLKLDQLKAFILDEADKMVEMGFIEDVERILSATPQERQILLFGATISREIDHLKKKFMHNVVVAEAELQVKKDLLEQYYYNVRSREKFSLLVHLLKKEETKRVIIFCSKRSTVELVNKNLRNQEFKSEMIHGKMTQNKRLHVIERFNEDKVHILVASAVAARGLDIRDVTHVFNYDLSPDPQEYVHRVGRTARAGESGKAFTLLSEQDHEAFRHILDRYGMEVDELPEEDFAKVPFEVQRRPQRGHFGREGHHKRAGFSPRRNKHRHR